MKLKDAIQNMESFDDEDTICAKKTGEHWFYESECTIVKPPTEQGEDIVCPKDMLYLLEIFLCKEVIEAYKKHFNNDNPTLEQKVEAVIFYAENDNYL